MNNNKFDATSLFNDLINVQYCEQGRDLKQERDVLDIFIANKFEPITIQPSQKTKTEKQLIDDGKGSLSKLALKYKMGLYVAHHPFGKNRYPDFLVLINGKVLEFEVKSAGSSDTPIFSQGDKVVDPTRRDAFYVFTHKTQQTALLMAEDLITPENYLLIHKQKAERDLLQQKHDIEFNRVCNGKGEKVYHRTNLTPRGGQEVTNHIFRARQNDLCKKVHLMLQTYQFNCTL